NDCDGGGARRADATYSKDLLGCGRHFKEPFSFWIHGELTAVCGAHCRNCVLVCAAGRVTYLEESVFVDDRPAVSNWCWAGLFLCAPFPDVSQQRGNAGLECASAAW